ncbi:Auxin-induced protein 22E [Ancistrocladus abbreviatus]
MDRLEVYDSPDLNLKATELRLGLPGSDELENQLTSSSVARSNKRSSPEMAEDCGSSTNNSGGSDARDRKSELQDSAPPPAKVQVVGWPPVRSYRKNSLQGKKSLGEHHRVDGTGIYVKVSMDGAPYLRKIDLRVYKSYVELLKALGNMFEVKIGNYSDREGYNGSDYAPTYEDKDGDWMLVGDVPWEMFISSCKRLRIMRSSEAKGLGCL